MKFQFLYSWPFPVVLAAVWLVAGWLIAWRSRAAPGAPVAASRAKRNLALFLQGIAALCLILAAAGLQYRHSARKIQLVVLADVSPSIFELSAQTARIRELLGALDPQSTEAAVVVFSETAGLERAMAPLPQGGQESAVRGQGSGLRSQGSGVRGRESGVKNPVPDLEHLSAVVKTDGTNIGGALQFARSAFTSDDCSRAILLLSDFLDTQEGGGAGNTNQESGKCAAFLAGSGIDFLATPAVLVPSSDVQLAELRAPDSATLGRAVPLEITIASQHAATVKVSVARRSLGQTQFVDARIVQLDAAPPGTPARTELRKTVRILDHSAPAGLSIYTAKISAPDGTDIPGDVKINNALSAAVRVDGPSKWAVLARRDSTLAKLASAPDRPLGVASVLFFPDRFPTEAAAFGSFAGIAVDGLSAEELPPDGAALRAVCNAVDQGKALVALGGDAAFGAGNHPRDGAWERVLPIEMTPEDDRARAVLFLIDVSKSMNDNIAYHGAQVRKMDFAAEQLQEVVGQLRPQDRLGLIEFSDGAKLAAPLASEPLHGAFLNAIHDIHIEAQTDIFSGLDLARRTLDADNSEEKLVILISDGIDTSGRPGPEIVRAAEKLCPTVPGSTARPTTLWTFGIAVGREDANAAGEALLSKLAQAGGGQFFPEFPELGKLIKKTIGVDKKEFYTRRERFVPQAGAPHALVSSNTAWPALNFRNRVKAKSGAETILLSRAENAESAGGKKSRPDPLLVLSGPGAAGFARRAALALTLDGADGARLLAPGSAGRTLVASLLSWAEVRAENESSGLALTAEPFGNDKLAVELRAMDPKTGEPLNTLTPAATLTVLQSADMDVSSSATEPIEFALHAAAPGTYRGTLRVPAAAICRLSVRAGATTAERFISTPCPAEARRFGVDRAAMAAMVAEAGPGALAIETPRDLAQWAAGKSGAAETADLRGWLIGLALGLLMLEYALRGTKI